jgi:hypothetical protein
LDVCGSSSIMGSLAFTVDLLLHGEWVSEMLSWAWGSVNHWRLERPFRCR